MLARTSPTGTTGRQKAATTATSADDAIEPPGPRTWTAVCPNVASPRRIANGHDRRRWSGLGRRGRGRLTSCRFECAWGWRRSRGRQEPTAAALACRPELGQLLTNRGHFGLQCRELLLEVRAPLLGLGEDLLRA